MAIVSIHNLQVQPGRTDELVAYVREDKSHAERFGVNLDSIRLFRVANVKPGQSDEFTSLNRSASELAHAAGAERVMCRAIIIGGTATYRVVSVGEYTDMAAWAECAPGSDKLATNPDWQELAASALVPDGPIVPGSMRIGLLTEIEL
jgi:hypothetical protein